MKAKGQSKILPGILITVLALISIILFSLFVVDPKEVKFLYSLIKKQNPALPNSEAVKIARAVYRTCQSQGVPWPDVTGIIWWESGFNPKIPGSAGEKGLGQITTGALQGVCKQFPRVRYNPDKLWEIDYNVLITVLYYKYCLDQSGGHILEAYARYGPGEPTSPEAVSYATGVYALRMRVIEGFKNAK